jgi:hypothetical protein
MLEQVGIVERKAWLEYGDDMTVSLFDRKLSVEAKDVRKYDLAGWINQAVRQAPLGHIPVVVAHRYGSSKAEDGYVIMRGQDFLRLVARD